MLGIDSVREQELAVAQAFSETKTVDYCVTFAPEGADTWSYKTFHTGRIVDTGKRQPIMKLLQALQRILEQELSAKSIRTKIERHLDVRTPDLTKRQLDILDLLQRGYSSKEISARLSLHKGTVDNHVTALLRALDATNRGHAIAKAIEHGIIRRTPAF